jgi:2-desacetyl-2-hydroxyethyl bacteriochlorophyllide A dehydrogenase
MSAPSRRVLRFTAPRSISVDTTPLPEPGPDEVRVRTSLSAVSPGTEKLVYRGEAPSTLAADADIDALSGGLEFPLTYGYAAVGRVTAIGAEVPACWEGERVFSFQPHVSHFTATPDALVPLPDDVDDADAVLLPNVETAVNLCMDGRPMMGEDVVVFGQGVVGLLTTRLLADHPVGTLYTVEPRPGRRDRSTDFGADRSFAPDALSAMADRLDLRHADAREADDDQYEGADLVYELSGQPDVVNQALSVAGYAARIVLGSWYGRRKAPIDLGGRFHRSHVEILSSQVSRIHPRHRGRWTKGRRMTTVLRLLPELRPRTLITDTVPLDEAASVYRRFDEEDDDLLQPVFRYD